MATLYNTIERASSIFAVAKVTLELVWDKDDQSVPLNTVEENSPLGEWSTTTDENGKWTFTNIDPNTDITPADNLYKVIEDVNGEEPLTSYVNITGNGTYWLGDVLVAKPVWED